MAGSSVAPFRFGGVRARSRLRRTAQGWRSYQTADAAAQGPALLASRAGELVTREEIQQHVWGDRAFLDFEHGLNFCIRQVRSALNDDPAIEI